MGPPKNRCVQSDGHAFHVCEDVGLMQVEGSVSFLEGIGGYRFQVICRLSPPHLGSPPPTRCWKAPGKSPRPRSTPPTPPPPPSTRQATPRALTKPPDMVMTFGV
jgi:hypothetical protein